MRAGRIPSQPRGPPHRRPHGPDVSALKPSRAVPLHLVAVATGHTGCDEPYRAQPQASPRNVPIPLSREQHGFLPEGGAQLLRARFDAAISSLRMRIHAFFRRAHPEAGQLGDGESVEAFFLAHHLLDRLEVLQGKFARRRPADHALGSTRRRRWNRAVSRRDSGSPGRVSKGHIGTGPTRGRSLARMRTRWRAVVRNALAAEARLPSLPAGLAHGAGTKQAGW